MSLNPSKIILKLQKRKDQRNEVIQNPQKLPKLDDKHDPMNHTSKIASVRNAEMEIYRSLHTSGVLPTELIPPQFRYSVPEKEPDNGFPPPPDDNDYGAPELYYCDHGDPELDNDSSQSDNGDSEPYVDLSDDEQEQQNPIEDPPITVVDAYLMQMLLQKLEARLTDNNADLAHTDEATFDALLDSQPKEITEAEIKTTFFNLFEATIKGLKTRLYWSAVVDHLVDGSFSYAQFDKFVSDARIDFQDKLDTLALPDARCLVRRVERMLKRVNGCFLRITYCKNRCMAFTDAFKDIQCCQSCKQRRDNKIWFGYFDVSLLIAAILSNPSLVKRMEDYNVKIMNDIFGTKRYKQLCEMKDANGNRLIKSDKDLFFTVMSDGVNVMNKEHLGVDVYCLVIQNLPPDLRYERGFVHIAMSTPSCSDNKYLHTFLYPLTETLKKLSTDGLTVEVVEKMGADDDDDDDAAATTTTNDEPKSIIKTVYGHVLNCTGDMPANAKMASHLAPSATFPCFCCNTERKMLRSVTFLTQKRLYYLLPSEYIINPHDFTVDDYTTAYDDVTDSTKNKVGINGRSAFTTLDSISQPVSFSPELMHLCFENVFKKMCSFLFYVMGENLSRNSNLIYAKMVLCKLFSSCNNVTKEKFMTSKHDGSYLKAIDWKLFLQNFHLLVFYCFEEDLVIQRRRMEKLYNPWNHFKRSRKESDKYPESLKRKLFSLVSELSFILQLVILLEYPEGKFLFLKNWIIGYLKKLEELREVDYVKDRILFVFTFPFHMLLHVVFYMEHFGPLRRYWSFCMERACRTVTLLSNATFSRIQSIGLTSMLNSTFRCILISKINYLAFGMKMELYEKGFNAPEIVFKHVRNATRETTVNSKEQYRYGLHKVSLLKLSGGDYTGKTKLCYFINKEKKRCYGLVCDIFHYTKVPVSAGISTEVTVLAYYPLPKPDFITETFYTIDEPIKVKAIHFLQGSHVERC
ncbi:unnamed protein product [Ambrosiozyma monospora]|uniref:Unnamed protein product n=1 Tax=Ambrosiozyma monospora TaxID=43982 RepID=A0ACB5SS59_AMBMO|nr:unnamed protein product [Ambrosiozyma monospora]